jgi:hypothetical protein
MTSRQDVRQIDEGMGSLEGHHMRLRWVNRMGGGPTSVPESYDRPHATQLASSAAHREKRP